MVEPPAKTDFELLVFYYFLVFLYTFRPRNNHCILNFHSKNFELFAGWDFSNWQKWAKIDVFRALSTSVQKARIFRQCKKLSLNLRKEVGKVNFCGDLRK